VEKEIAPSAERDYIVQFIRNSERGVMKGFSKSTSFE
jgi:hypothetical protein